MSLDWGGLQMNIRKNYIKYILALLLVLATIAILDNLRISDFAEEMQKENNKLVEKVDSLEKELSSRSNETGELKKENERLVENLSQLEEEVNALKPTILNIKTLLLLKTPLKRISRRNHLMK